MKRSLVVLLVLVGAALAGSGGALTASDFTCTGFSSGQTYNNVVVPAGAACTLDNTTVLGNVTVKTAADLTVTTGGGDSTVRGSVKGPGCDSIDLEATGAANRIAVGGDLVITNCTGVTFSGARGSSGPGTPPQSVVIGGNTKCDNVDGGCVFDYVVLARAVDCSGNDGCTLNSSAIGDNATVNNNTGPGARINNNVIAGNLGCNGNSAVTNAGAPNTVAGTESGQCSAPF